MVLEQEIVELVRLSAAEGVRDMDFSSPWINVRSGSLISVESASKSAEYINQLCYGTLWT